MTRSRGDVHDQDSRRNYDGKVFRPSKPLDLPPNRRYRLTVETEPSSEIPCAMDAWDVLESLAGTVEAPEDWSEEHDHYLYGTARHGAVRKRPPSAFSSIPLIFRDS